MQKKKERRCFTGHQQYGKSLGYGVEKDNRIKDGINFNHPE